MLPVEGTMSQDRICVEEDGGDSRSTVSAGLQLWPHWHLFCSSSHGRVCWATSTEPLGEESPEEAGRF